MLVERVFSHCKCVTAQQLYARIVYTKDQLIILKPASMEEGSTYILKEIRDRPTGDAEGDWAEEEMGHKTAEATTMGSVRSITNKIDELTAQSRGQREYRIRSDAGCAFFPLPTRTQHVTSCSLLHRCLGWLQPYQLGNNTTHYQTVCELSY